MARLWEFGDHAGLLYATDGERQRIAVVEFIAALDNGEKIAYQAPGTSEEIVLSWLSEAGYPLDSVMARGQLVIWPEVARENFPHFVRVETLVAEKAGYRGLVACVDRGVPSGGVRGHEARLDYETWLEALLAEDLLLELTLLCHYDQRRFPEYQLGELMRCHSVTRTSCQILHPEPPLRITPLADLCGLRISGEFDESSLDRFSSALESAFKDDHDFCLDLADLQYLDAASAEFIALTATRLRGEHRLILRAPAPLVRTILRVRGWDRLPGLDVVDEWPGDS